MANDLDPTEERHNLISELLENALVDQLRDSPTASVMAVARMYLRDCNVVPMARANNKLHLITSEVEARMPFPPTPIGTDL